MTTTIVTSDSFAVRGSEKGRPVDYTQNGVIWVAIGETADPAEMRFYYSTDNGVNWTLSVGSNLSATEPPGSSPQPMGLFIDKDDNAHLIYCHIGPTGEATELHYRLGLPNQDRTQWTWSASIALGTESTSGGAFITGDVVAHREGSGWKAHVIYEDDRAGTATVQHAIIDITASKVATLESRTEVFSGGTGTPVLSIDFRHEQDDPKAVQSSTPSVYAAWVIDGIATVLRFVKIAYSAGTWTAGTVRTIDAATQSTDGAVFSLVYDGTRIVMAHVRSATTTVVRVDERDEADTTTTSRDPTALASSTVAELNVGYFVRGGIADIWLFASGATVSDWKKIRFNRTGASWDAAWTTVDSSLTSLAVGSGSSMMRGVQQSVVPSLGLVWRVTSVSPDQTRYDFAVSAFSAEALLQGVATIAANENMAMGVDAVLQGVGTVSPNPKMTFGANATLQGIGTLDPGATFTPKLDFTVYDLYLDDGQNVYAAIVHEDAETKGTTNANPIRAEKQDVGQNPLEQRPEFGDHFAQGDFSHGADQDYFHHAGRDERKFLASEGFDIGEPGVLRHLHTVGETLDSTTVGAVAQAGDGLFATDGTSVKRHDGILPGQWANEDPHAAEGATTVEDITSRGAEVFAALGVNGVHIRDSVGAWTHFRPDGATNLVVGTATRVAWLKDRLMVVGTGGREIFEVLVDSTPTALKTLPEGWTFENVFEAGAFLYAPAVNADAGLSRIHIFGLNSAASSLEDKGSVPIPRGELIYVGIGDPGGIFLGGGRRTPEGGYDPVFYQAIQSQEGFLQLLKITQGEGAQALDCSVRAFESLGDAIVFSWSIGSGAPTGARTGLGWYHLGRAAFAFHLKKEVASAAPVTDIIFHRGVLFFVVKGDGVYFENMNTFVGQAYLLSSIADWGTAGLKSWDQSEVSHKALPSTSSVVLQYSTEHPDEGLWTNALTSSIAGSLGAAGRLSDIVSRLFAVRLISNAASGGASAPEIQTFSVRSNPTRSSPEFILTRFLRVLPKDRKDPKAAPVTIDPVARRIALQQLLDSWVTVYEPGITWTAFVKDVSDAEPAEPFLSATNGERLKEAYLVRLDMVASGVAA